ncbi:MAG TPA: hypothetical protein VHD90_28030 [Phototrophicaceae bacterium]|nr:hypothetical protein [Phototrophicaceae bacterium]
MAASEDIEKMRQGIMRFRELLDLMRDQLEEGERAYAQLFAHRSAEEKTALKEKELQGRAALDLLDDPSPLGNAAVNLRFAARNLERDFEQLYDNIMTE